MRLVLMIQSERSFAPVDIPATIRLMCSHVILWKNRDINSITVLASRFNLKAKDLKYTIDHICKDKPDSFFNRYYETIYI